ncbi:MAG: hypothetical protein ACRDIC_07810 [bacterium]
MPDARPVGLDLPDGLHPWLAAFVLEMQRETETLRDNGAEQAAAARTALLRELLGAARAWLDAEFNAGEAAREKGVCQETIRRAVRSGAIPDHRANAHGHHRIRRGDLQKLAGPPGRSYDPVADAQDIARLRRRA